MAILKKVRGVTPQGLVVFVNVDKIITVRDKDQQPGGDAVIQYQVGSSYLEATVDGADGLKLIDGTWA